MKTLFFAPILLISACATFATSFGVHGMLLFGKQSSYISHLPMFHAPHDFQLIAEVELTAKGKKDVITNYENAKKHAALFTIVPPAMDLEKVVNGEQTSFPATIYEGHFERGGKPIGEVMVSIKKPIVAKRIEAARGPSPDFLAFGHGGEYFFAHLIYGKPTYDAIYQVGQPTKTHIPRCGRGSCGEPIEVPISDFQLPQVVRNDNASFASTHPENITVGSRLGVHVLVTSPLYVEYEELAH